MSPLTILWLASALGAALFFASGFLTARAAPKAQRIGTEVLEADSYDAAHALLQNNPDVDVVLLDLLMPGFANFDGLGVLVRDFPGVPVVVLSGSGHSRYQVEAVRRGARGYIVKSQPLSVLCQIIQIVKEGGTYVSTSVLDPGATLEPALTGWQADEEPFRFRTGPIHYARDAWRFLTGTPNIPALHSCRPGYRLVAEAGIERIRERSLGLTRRLMLRAEAQGFEVRTPVDDARRGGTVSVWHPEAERLTREHGVAVIPLSAFHADGQDDRVVRVCFAKEEATLAAACERLARM